MSTNKVSPQMAEEMKALYQQGMSMKDIGTRFDVSHVTVWYHVTKSKSNEGPSGDTSGDTTGDDNRDDKSPSQVEVAANATPSIAQRVVAQAKVVATPEQEKIAVPVKEPAVIEDANQYRAALIRVLAEVAKAQRDLSPIARQEIAPLVRKIGTIIEELG